MSNLYAAESTAPFLKNIDSIPRICETIGFTSAFGGSGTTSAAQALSRIYTNLFEYKTLYLSFDYLSMKACPKSRLVQSGMNMCGRDVIYGLLFENQIANGKFTRDEFGVYYMPPDEFKNPLHFLSEEQMHKLIQIFENDFDRIVLDIPLNSLLSGFALDICDSVAVCSGWQKDDWEKSEELINYLKAERDGIFSFRVNFDENMTDDLYGKFSTEVRSLAETIEGR